MVNTIVRDTVYTGVLGDPAKINKYNDEFYALSSYYNHLDLFYLLGASERDVPKENINTMYSKLIYNNQNKKFYKGIPPLKMTDQSHFSSRVGLFPSGINQLIKGPKFTFAPYPANSKSGKLKLKSKLSIKFLKYFLSTKLLPTAYYPQGGLASERTQAILNIDDELLATLMYKNRQNKWFSLHYIEAGSGQSLLSIKLIQNLLRIHALAMTGKQKKSQKEFKVKFTEDNIRILIPGMIYGGGITKIDHIRKLLLPEDGSIFIPEIVILGNINETNISNSYSIYEKIREFNEIITISVLDF